MNRAFKKDFIEPDVTPQVECPSCAKTIYVKSHFSDQTSAELISIKSIMDGGMQSQECTLIHCSNCGGEFERAEIMPSLIKYMAVTKAISAAKSILTFNAVVFFVAVSILLDWWFSTLIAELGDFAIFVRILAFTTLFMCLSPLITILNWFASYGRLKSNDAELFEAKRNLKMSLTLWLAVTVLTFMALKHQGWFHDFSSR